MRCGKRFRVEGAKSEGQARGSPYDEMSGHEQFAEDLALYALNALEGEDRANLEKHLATCSACRLELEQLRGDGAMLALSTMGPKPPQRARQRLLDAVAKKLRRLPPFRKKRERMGHPPIEKSDAASILVGMFWVGPPLPP